MNFSNLILFSSFLNCSFTLLDNPFFFASIFLFQENDHKQVGIYKDVYTSSTHAYDIIHIYMVEDRELESANVEAL
jgi:hypothetical protein